METQFNFNRTLQAVVHLLKLQPRPLMGYIRLVKLLYLADREMLAEHLMPITGDSPFAMKKGPILSKTLNLIRGIGSPEEVERWRNYVKRDGYAISMVGNPGHGELSRAIRQKLEEVNRRYAEMDDDDLIEETHKLPEWLKHFVPETNASYPFTWEEVMAYQGKSEQAITKASADEEARQALEQLLGG